MQWRWGSPSFHCWANRAIQKLLLPLQVSSSCRRTFSLVKDYSCFLCLCVCRGSVPFHIRTQLDLWSGYSSLLALNLLLIANTAFQWGSFLQHWAVFWNHQRTAALEATLPVLVTSDLMWPACFHFPLLSSTLLCPHTINSFLSGISFTSPLNSFCF